MILRPLLYIVIASAPLLACAPPGADWTSNEAPRQLRVDFQRLTHTASFVPGTAQLDRGEEQGLMAFLAVAQTNPDDPVYLEAPADDKTSGQRISALTRSLSRQGFAVATLPPARDVIPPNALLVVVERYSVTPPECPNWTKSPAEDHDNMPSSNFGCANLTNLGYMVADPRDLVHGRQLGPADADAWSLAIQRYREGKTTALPALNAASTYSATSTGPGGGAPGTGSGSAPGQ